MPSVFSIIGSAWDFYKKQPVLNSILLWMLILPFTGMYIVEGSIGINETLGEFAWRETDLRPLLLIGAAEFLLTIIIIWGIASITVVGKRLLTSKAGRNRSSFTVVRKEGSKYIVNMFLTGILRDCFTIFWGILLIIPGVIYAIRTAFYNVTIVCEGLGYRKALRRSKEVVKGHTWTTFWHLLGLVIVIFFPAIIVAASVDELARGLDTRLLFAANIIANTVLSYAILLFALATIILYGEIKKLPNPKK
ncbi:MAG: hypothetical protein CL969_00195 [Euryarchaeota archaeon]|nr:hypothetical protein [Euryarchaeota archaeon]MDP6575189.1 hypothetical protein [Candidatus Peribacteraceae bacterium]HCI03300.1 hypothetical protein [Candidatus Peribacteria bacterium]